jgi:hypothetical protein
VIKLICFNIEDKKYVPQKVYETKAAFYALRQGRDSDQTYQIKFMNTVQVIEQCGASLGEDPLTRIMVCKDLGYQTNTTDATELAEITKNVRDYTLGAALILGSGASRTPPWLAETKDQRTSRKCINTCPSGRAMMQAAEYPATTKERPSPTVNVSVNHHLGNRRLGTQR